MFHKNHTTPFTRYHVTTCWRHTVMTRLSSLFFNLSKMSWWANYLAQIPCFPISTITPRKLPKNPGEQHGILPFSGV